MMPDERSVNFEEPLHQPHRKHRHRCQHQHLAALHQHGIQNKKGRKALPFARLMTHHASNSGFSDIPPVLSVYIGLKEYRRTYV